MIDFERRKQSLLQDIATQRGEIERIARSLEDARALLARLEGAVLLCDEFITEQKAEKRAPA